MTETWPAAAIADFRLLGWQWGLLAVAMGIVALYFLKLRRTPRRVPSTYLWMRAVEDMHVNSLFQRLRRNLLLLLQLLVIGLVFAAFFPLSCMVQRNKGNRYILLIDNSASMSATDIEPSRLEAAKQQALAIVDQMTHRDDAAMVIAFADGATQVNSFTKSKSLLRSQIQTIEPTQLPTSIANALQAAAGLANPGSVGENADPKLMAAELFIFTDGRFPNVEEFALGNLQPHFVTIGSSSRNFGIAAMSTRLNEERPDQLQIFARVANFSEHLENCPDRRSAGSSETPSGDLTGQECTCPGEKVLTELFLDNQSQDAREIQLKPGQSSGVSFDLAVLRRGLLRLRLDVDDDFAIDNVAWSAVNPARPAEVLMVGPDNPFLELALETERAREMSVVQRHGADFLQSEEYRRDADAGRYDLIIYDRCVPKTMPQANTWMIGRLPATEGFPGGTPADWPIVLDTDRVHRLMHYVEMDKVEIASLLKIEPPQESHTLVQTDQGPALLLVPREGFQDLVMTFELVTDGKVVPQGWQIHRSFPVFIFNVLRELGRAGDAFGTASIKPGQPKTLYHGRPVQSVRVEAPAGDTYDVQRNAQGTYWFGDTARTGLYRVDWPGQEESDYFAVNLFDANESNIAPRPELEIGYQKIDGAGGTHRERQDLWKYLLLAALGVLLAEWYVYQRRVYF